MENKNDYNSDKINLSILLITMSTIMFISLKWIFWAKTAKRNTETPRADKVVVRVWTSQTNVKYPGESFGHVSLELQMDGMPGSLADRTYISVGPGKKLDKTNNIRPHNVFSQHLPKYIESYRDDLIYEERTPELTFIFHTLDAKAMQQEFTEHLTDTKTWWALCSKISVGEATYTFKEKVVNVFNRLVDKCIEKTKIFDPKPFSSGYLHQPAGIPYDKPNLVSCVSLIQDIMIAGCLSKLVNSKESIMAAAIASQDASNQSSRAISDRNTMAVCKSIGYAIEHGVSIVMMSPDVFADLLMCAKINEMESLDDYSKDPKEFSEILQLEDGTTKSCVSKEWMPKLQT